MRRFLCALLALLAWPALAQESAQKGTSAAVRADGGAGGAGGVTDGDKGDVTVASGTWTIDDAAVSFAKMVNASAASKLAGRGSAAGAGPFQEITIGTGLTMTGTTLSSSGGITNGAGANVVPKSDGTNLVATALSEASAGAFATSAGTALGFTATAPAATTGASQAGKNVTITASPAVASTDTDGAAAGGDVTFTAGNAARRTSGNANGGGFVFDAGAPIGTGANGTFIVKNSRVQLLSATAVSGIEAPAFLLDMGQSNVATDGIGWPYAPNAASRNWLIRSDTDAWGDFTISTSSTKTAGLADVRRLTISPAGAFVFGAGSPLTQTATTGGATASRGSISELITLSTVGTTTDSSADLLPANSLIDAVTCRITTTITTATDWAVGDGTTVARFSSANATMTAGTTSIGLNHRQPTATDAAGPVQSSATKLRITTTGTPGAGAIRCTTFYTQFTAPTS